MKIKDLNKNVSLTNVRFIYPGDGQKYYWTSQWRRGVWGKKDISTTAIFPLSVESLEETLEWEVAE